MSRKKYVYVITNIKTGSMLVEEWKLPFYWNMARAKQRAAQFPKYRVTRIDENDLYLTIVSGQILTNNNKNG